MLSLLLCREAPNQLPSKKNNTITILVTIMYFIVFSMCHAACSDSDLHRCMRHYKGVWSSHRNIAVFGDFEIQSPLRAAQIFNDERILTNIQYKVRIPLLLNSGIASRATEIMCAVKHCTPLFVYAEILIGAKALEMSQLLERYLIFY